MPRIYTNIEFQSKREKVYEAYLQSVLPAEGCYMIEGPHVFLLEKEPEIDASKGKLLPVDFGPCDMIYSLSESSEKAIGAYRSFAEGRRLPAGMTVIVIDQGIMVRDTKDYEIDLGKMEPFTLSFDPLEEVITAQEAATIYKIDVKRIQGDLEAKGYGVFGMQDGRKSDKTWLLLKRRAEEVYGNLPQEKLFMNPLLLVFSASEGGKLWNRDPASVRSAAAGAGHMAARMGEGERRKSGRTWLVTRAAMERLYGQASIDVLKLLK